MIIKDFIIDFIIVENFIVINFIGAIIMDFVMIKT